MVRLRVESTPPHLLEVLQIGHHKLCNLINRLCLCLCIHDIGSLADSGLSK